MPQDDNTTSSDPRASRSARRSVAEQEAKRRAAGSSDRASRPGAMSSSIKSTEADIESRNNARSSHRDRDGHSPRRHREHRDRHHRSGTNDRSDDRHRRSRTRSGSNDRDSLEDRDREAKRRARDGRSTKVGASSVSGSSDDRHRRTRSGSNDRDSLEDRDREAKRRAREGRSTKVGASSVSGSTRDSGNRKRREDEDRRSKQRARRNDSSSGATAPGALSSMAPSRGGDDARERKLRAAGLGLDDNNNKAEPNRKDDFEKDPNKSGYPDLGRSAAAEAPPPEAAMVDEDGAVHLQAELVDPDEDKKNMQAKMKEENERIQREMAAENERMRQQMQEDQDRMRQETQDNEQAEAEAKKKKQQKMICIIVVVLVAIAAAIGAFLGTRGSSSSSSPASVAPPATNPPTPATPTEAPVAPEVTTAPTETPPLYEAPSDEDCAAIANADPAGVNAEDNEGVTEVVGFDTTLDMTLSSNINPDEALPLLQEQLQTRTMTSMAGCTKEQIRSLERRQLRTSSRELKENKYVVLYAQVSSMEILEGESCQDASIPNCSKVLATMDMYLQGDELRFRLISRLVDLLSGKDDEDFDLARALGLPNAISSLLLDSVESNDPTLEPTVAPTKVPTTPAPTGAQTTPAPVPAPTPNPTPNPTPQATTRPPRPPPPTPGPTEEEEEEGDGEGDDTIDDTIDDGTIDDEIIDEEEEECTNFCLGEEACDGFDLEVFDVGCGSCNDKRSCADARADIGEESCLQGGCQEISGIVGNGSCDGKGACGRLIEVTIGNDSCNCDGCCRCIEDGDTVPDGSCNIIAETQDDIEYVPYETFRRVAACCLEPGTGDGGNDGGGDGEGDDTIDDDGEGDDTIDDDGDGDDTIDDDLPPPPNDGGDGGGGGGDNGGGGPNGGGGGGGSGPPPRPPN